ETLSKSPESAIPVVAGILLRSKSAQARRNALWTTSRFGRESTRFARPMLQDPDDSVRHVALHILSLYPVRDSVAELVELLEKGTPHDRRAAAEALGRIGDRSAVPALLASHKGE